MNILAKRLNQLIKENKITRYKVAKDLNYNKTTISNWCDGKNEPKATQVKELAMYFDISADYLLGLEDETGTKISGSKYSIGVINNSGNIDMK